MKKIVFFSIPLFGHVNYGLKIAKRLKKENYEVEYYSGSKFKNFIEEKGVTFKAYSNEIERLFLEESSSYNDNYMQYIRAEKQDHISEWYKFCHHLYTIVDLFFKYDIKDMDKPDLIIYDSAALWGRYIAKFFNIPCVASCTPYTYPTEYVHEDYSRFAKLMFVQEMTDLEAKRVIYMLNATLNKSIQSVKDASILEPLCPCADYRLIYTTEEFQSGYKYISDKKNYFVGIMLNENEEIEDCKDILSDKSKNVYIAFGSIYNNAEVFLEIMELCKNINCHFILNVGNTIDKALFKNLPENWTIVNRVNQIALLKKVDIFVSHGGVNSVREAMHFGVPLVVIPTEGDTLCAAEDIKRNNVGVVLDIKNMNNIGRVIKEVLNNIEMKNNCEHMAKMMQSKGGLARVVNIINTILEEK